MEHLPSEVDRVLDATATDPDGWEPYHRFAELLELVQSPYLKVLVERAAASDNVDIREVADDYGSNDLG